MQKSGNHLKRGTTVPVSPSLGSVLANAQMARQSSQPINRRVLLVSVLAIGLGAIAAFVAYTLTALIGLVTNVAFYGHLDFGFISPANNHLGLWVIVIPVLGGLIVGLMARLGSRAIRGHGIPEAMEQILLNESRIPPRITWLKPVSSAIAIGTGGPFGAEGPIIATGGALGSLLGQLTHVTADERKTLLASGAAAGMAAIFATPVAAVLLAIELLLFEWRARSLIPVALAAATSTGLRFLLEGSEAVFAMSAVNVPGLAALGAYVLLGVVCGLAGVLITKLIYAIEDVFEKLPIHWMWWPAIGGVAVGVVGYFMPQTLGVGYDNIIGIINGQLGWDALLALCLLKLLSWSIALGSGTSGGTLAPLFTIGGAFGGVVGIAITKWLPWVHVDPRMTALVGMAALFAGASRAFLTAVVFAFETTQQSHGLLPLLGACATAYLVSGLLMRNTIMTEKIHRRGVRVPTDYSADYLDQVTVGEICSRNVIVLEASRLASEVRTWLGKDSAESQHQGFPVIDSNHQIIGMVTRKELSKAAVSPAIKVGELVYRNPLVVQESHSAREAADYMVETGVGRLIVVANNDSHRMTGIITRGDLLAAHSKRIKESRYISRYLVMPSRLSQC